VDVTTGQLFDVIEAAPPPGPVPGCQADLALETEQLQRYLDRVQQATELGRPDVAEALRPLLTETQEHVRDLPAALGQ
jgi:bacterioferritin